MGRESDRFLVRKRSFSWWTSPSKGALRQSSGNSSRMARGSTTAPESAWLVISRPFSSTPIESSRPLARARRARWYAPARLAGPVPTKRTSSSRVSRSSLMGGGCYHGALRPSWEGKPTAYSAVPDGGIAVAERLRVSRVAAARSMPTFAEDVRRGLTSSPKFLFPKYFYDELGSRLFEAITALPEYYPTRAEAEILRLHAGEIVAALGGPVWTLELGSGDGQKTR